MSAPALSGAYSTPPHLQAVGLEEQGYHLVRQGPPILTAIDHVEVPGGVMRPLVDPVPLYAWSMAWRRGSPNEALAALREAAADVATAEGWLDWAGDEAAGTSAGRTSLDPRSVHRLPSRRAHRRACRRPERGSAGPSSAP